MRSISKVKFISSSFGISKPKEGKSGTPYFKVSFLDDESKIFTFFVFERSELFSKLKNVSFQFGQELICVTAINNFTNLASLVSLEVQNGK